MSADYARIHDPGLREHFVYSLYGRRGHLLYVGCSMNLALRLREHSRRFGLALARVETLGPFTYQIGRRVERELIETRPGKYNLEWTNRYVRGYSPTKRRSA